MTSPGITDLTLDRWARLNQERKDAIDEWLDRRAEVEAKDVYRVTVLGDKAIVFYYRRNEAGQLTTLGGDIDKSYKIVETRGWPLL